MDPSQYTKVNGRPAISLDISKRIGTNIIENNIAVRAAVEAATANWPKVIKVDILSDQSTYIFDMLASLQSAILNSNFFSYDFGCCGFRFKVSIVSRISYTNKFHDGFFHS